MSLHPYVQPPEEDLYYDGEEPGDSELDTLAAAAAMIHSLQLARQLASRLFAPGAEFTDADAHLYEAIRGFDRAGVLL